MKPIIGVISYPYYDKDNTMVFETSEKVVKWVNEVGGISICIVPSNNDNYYEEHKRNLKDLNKEELVDLKRILSMCDGIIKPGSYYFFPFQKEIYKYTLKTGIPYLGICNGMQLMPFTTDNLKMEKNNSDVCHSNGYHRVYIKNNTLLYSILNKEEIVVKSFHNYHIPGINDDYIVTSRSIDGYIESVEHKELPYNIGVQWHPEADNNENSYNLFESLVVASKVYNLTKNKKKYNI